MKTRHVVLALTVAASTFTMGSSVFANGAKPPQQGPVVEELPPNFTGGGTQTNGPNVMEVHPQSDPMNLSSNPLGVLVIDQFEKIGGGGGRGSDILRDRVLEVPSP